MPNLSNILNRSACEGSKNILESYFQNQASSRKEASLASALQNLSEDDHAQGWKENDSIRSGVDITITNRAHIQKSLTGWRVGADGIRTYTTYRSGQLVTVSGAEAMRYSMGDQKGKGKGKGEGKGKGKGKGEGGVKGKGEVEGAVQVKRKGVEQKVDSTSKRQKKVQVALVKEVEKEVVGKEDQNVLLRGNVSAPTLVDPAPYTGPSSELSDEVDWGF
jgi:hypothetical protein